MNPKTGKSYKVDFVVIEASCASQEMVLIEVKYENMAVKDNTKSVPVLTKELFLKGFPEVFLVS